MGQQQLEEVAKKFQKFGLEDVITNGNTVTGFKRIGLNDRRLVTYKADSSGRSYKLRIQGKYSQIWEKVQVKDIPNLLAKSFPFWRDIPFFISAVLLATTLLFIDGKQLFELPRQIILNQESGQNQL